jgi:tRNA1(Val) A37 N6-methylase TrmN6
MTRHYSPLAVAKVLSAHAPKQMTSILEPAVGQGDLLKPLLTRYRNSLRSIVCIDADAATLRGARIELQQYVGGTSKLSMVFSDFIEWSSSMTSDRKRNSFDCIIMNPPFVGKARLIRLDLARESQNTLQGKRSLPVEGAFVWRAIHLLKPGGKLLAVVPSSVISWMRTSWLRKYLMGAGSIDYVHELPKFTFRSVEARVYLLVYTKGKVQRDILLRNHDLLDTVSMRVSREEILNHSRFDYRFHFARRLYEKTMTLHPNLGWARVGDIAKVYRGSIKSPLGTRCAIHTNFFDNGFWRLVRRRNLRRNKRSPHSVKSSDLLIKRVSRRCAKTLGQGNGLENYLCSDCILIIRTNNKGMSNRLLFSLRTLLTSEIGRDLLERGTGATYIAEVDLLNLCVPLDLFKMHRNLYSRYIEALSRRDIGPMLDVEKILGQKYGL